MANSRESYYHILGINKEAKLSEIKKAYHALVHRSDKKGNPEKFKQIQEAYACLSNPSARQVYDQDASTHDKDALEALVTAFSEKYTANRAIDSANLLGISVEVFGITDPTILNRLHLLIMAINSKLENTLDSQLQQQYINAVASGIRLAKAVQLNDAEKIIFIDFLENATESISQPTSENLKKFEADLIELEKILDQESEAYTDFKTFCKAFAFAVVLSFIVGPVPASLITLVLPSSLFKTDALNLQERDKTMVKTSYKGIFEAQKNAGQESKKTSSSDDKHRPKPGSGSGSV